MIVLYKKRHIFSIVKKHNETTKQFELLQRWNYRKRLDVVFKNYSKLKDLFICMLEYNPRNRFSVRDCLTHCYFLKRRELKHLETKLNKKIKY